jgi:hypothetical protein
MQFNLLHISFQPRSAGSPRQYGTLTKFSPLAADGSKADRAASATVTRLNKLKVVS